MMKKLFVLFLVAGYCITGIANKTTNSFVASNSVKTDAKRIKVGVINARIVLLNGEKELVPISQLSSYSIDGKVFNKVPLYINGKSSGRMVFMELVKTRGDYSIYTYEYKDYDSLKPYEKIKAAYLFNGDKFQMQLDEKTLADVCNFFGLRAVIE